MDSCGWTRMGNEEGEGMAGGDAATSWQQCYTWCASYSHPNSQHHHHHPHHPRQYQGNQYQQLPSSASAAVSTHYSSSQQHHLQLQTAQLPSLDQQHHPMRGQTGLRRTIPYDGSGTQIACKSTLQTMSIIYSMSKKPRQFLTKRIKLNNSIKL